MSTAHRFDVSIVLPIFNEFGHLADEIDRIRKAMDSSDYSYEIVVVDDGSTDGSGDRLAELDGIRFIRFAQNRGSGAARRWGTDQAQGRVVVWTDVDMTYPNDEIPEMVAEMESRGLDQLVGARRSEQGTLKLLRMPAKWLIRRLASYLAKVPIPDLNSGLRVFRRDVGTQFLYLLPRGFSCVTTITMAFLANGYSVGYRPIDYFAREGSSKFHWWKDTSRYLLQVVRMALMWEPVRIFGPPALVVAMVGVGKLAYDVFWKDFRVATNTVVLLAVAFAFATIAMLADLMVQLNRRRHEVMPAEKP
ncbi:MAG TPA: glycosyltransferase family 2 protein [Acidimicrobiia bacterium]|nr:glycosyltransferase family 2 protein [Acidimicrobiia bacterium]